MSKQKVSFIYAYPLDQERRRLFASQEREYPSMEEVKNVIQHWRALWEETEAQHNILNALAEITSRTPTRNLECFVFGAGMQVMSTPFLLTVWNKAGQQWTDEKFIDLMIHELLHLHIAVDNKAYWDFVAEKYCKEEPVCQYHIALYAMLYKLYQQFFKTEPIDFLRLGDKPPGYQRAIQLVNDNGYQELLDEYNSLV